MAISTLTATEIRLEVHLCRERRSIFVTFPVGTDAAAADFVARRRSYAACSVSDEDGWEIGVDHLDWPLLAEALDPTCEHGMSEQSCYGPGHFMDRDQEIARYGY